MPITERGQQLNVWMIVFTCLTTATFVGRAFAFGLQKRKLRGDDFLITISFVRKSVATLRTSEIDSFRRASWPCRFLLG
jgi:hypothetical protein